MRWRSQFSSFFFLFFFFTSNTLAIYHFNKRPQIQHLSSWHSHCQDVLPFAVCAPQAGNLCLSSPAQKQVTQSGTSVGLILKDCLLSICPLFTQASPHATLLLCWGGTKKKKQLLFFKAPNLPIWPNLHLGCATTLPPIQKNSSASLEMDALCHSFGELMMDGEGDVKGLGSFLAWWAEPRMRFGENMPAERDPRDWKVVFLCDAEVSGGPSLGPGDKGAIAGVLLIPEQCNRSPALLSHSHHVNPPPPPPPPGG